ncbi:MAG: LysM peptidoglycan-binding domain-containing protein [Gammaproteobacteria bacterium]
MKQAGKLIISSLSLLYVVACQSTASIEPSESFNLDKENLNTEILDNENLAANAAVTEPVYLPLLINRADISHPAEWDVELQDRQIDNNIWLRIAEGLTIDVPQTRRVTVQRDWYAKHQSYLNRVADRAEPFLYFIVEEIDKRNMPMELALLPIVESAFDPFAYSHGRASGMWQFIPGTGKRFKLEQNWWYDGRRDVYASTFAALDYLEYLHKLFNGDWLHALAAYNSGEGNVRRAIRNNKKRNKPTDFWNLRLPKETKAYVPKLLALADLLKRDDEFALNWKPIANQPAIAKVDIGSQLDLALAAEMAGMSIEEIYRYNPGFNRWSTAPKGPHYLILPLQKVAQFELALAATSPDERVRWLRYTIRNGDTLSTIAAKHNTTVATLRSVNRIRGTGIRAGKTLLIPTSSQSQNSYILSADRRLASKQNTQRSGTKQTYVVKPGDSFWEISRRYGVHHRTLAKWNGMAPTDPLKVGTKLVIWTKTPVTASVPASNVALDKQTRLRKIYYRVRRGDSLARISSKFAVSMNDLKRWNKSISQRKYLQPGDRLQLYVDITNQSGN